MAKVGERTDIDIMDEEWVLCNLCGKEKLEENTNTYDLLTKTKKGAVRTGRAKKRKGLCICYECVLTLVRDAIERSE